MQALKKPRVDQVWCMRKIVLYLKILGKHALLLGEAEVNQDWIVAGPVGIRPEINISKYDPNLSSQSSLRAGDENGRESHVEDFPEVKVDFQLLIGTADGGIKAWNVDAKRVCLRS
ncbi:hypothetical protein ACE6H2_016694 [Prunus campanulata]